jgi:hypothetical protein
MCQKTGTQAGELRGDVNERISFIAPQTDVLRLSENEAATLGGSRHNDRTEPSCVPSRARCAECFNQRGVRDEAESQSRLST